MSLSDEAKKEIAEELRRLQILINITKENDDLKKLVLELAKELEGTIRPPCNETCDDFGCVVARRQQALVARARKEAA